MQDAQGFWEHEYPNPFVTGVVVHALGRCAPSAARSERMSHDLLSSGISFGGSLRFGRAGGRCVSRDGVSEHPLAARASAELHARLGRIAATEATAREPVPA